MEEKVNKEVERVMRCMEAMLLSLREKNFNSIDEKSLFNMEIEEFRKEPYLFGITFGYNEVISSDYFKNTTINQKNGCLLNYHNLFKSFIE